MCGVVSVIVCTAALLSVEAQQGRLAPSQFQRSEDGRELPTDWNELVSKADFITRARVTRATVGSAKADGHSWVHTEWQLSGLQVVKEDVGRPDKPYVIVRRGEGDLVVNGVRIVAKASGPPVWAVGDDVVVLLRRLERTSGVYRLHYGPHGVFKIVNGLAEPVGAAPILTALRSIPVSDLIDKIAMHNGAVGSIRRSVAQ